MNLIDPLRQFLSQPIVIATWAVLVVFCLGILVRDLKSKNTQIAGLMKWVWALTVAYSGPVGLAVYFHSGRKQIRRDSLWRRGWRSTAHCYSGCGAGEIVGVFVAAGILALPNTWVAVTTFLLAYVAGFALTVGPLVQEGVSLVQASWDAFYSETASITVMEVTAIGVDLILAGGTGMGDSLFWASLVFSLSIGFIAAWPINVVLIRLGVKAGMHSPKDHGSTDH